MDEKGKSKSKKVKSTKSFEDVTQEETTALALRQSGVGGESALHTVFPNPVGKQGTLKLLLAAGDAGAATVTFVDLTGQVLYQATRDVIAGDNLLQIDLSRYPMPARMLLARIDLAGTTLVRKVLVVE